MDDLIDSNAKLAEAIFKIGFKTFLAPTLDADWVASIVPEKYAHDEFRVYSIVIDHLEARTNQTDMDKARSCVNQFYRDWSAEGAVERDQCFQPIIRALDEEFNLRHDKDSNYKKGALEVLVPGAGLGRLVFDICKAGYSVEGNEISYHELLASSLALNHTKEPGQFTIAPFALNCSNHRSRADQFRTFKVPDIHPGTELPEDASQRMSMSTGDFIVVYSDEQSRETFDAVATVFFIDTAPNVIRYIETVKNCLKPGGLWINLGPLLWHHVNRKQDSGGEEKAHDDTDTGIAEPGSVELTDEEVVALVEHFGFEIQKHITDEVDTGYISNPRSMLQTTYRPSHWVARKK
jgi:hypothetical protein